MLKSVRYQRRQALSVMRKVNEEFVLPNPPTWSEAATEVIKKAVAGLKQMVVSQEQDPVRVSGSD